VRANGGLKCLQRFAVDVAHGNVRRWRTRHATGQALVDGVIQTRIAMRALISGMCLSRE
jgi:hypothetical protein